MTGKDNSMFKVKVAELLPPEYHDQVAPAALEIAVPQSAFPEVNVEVLGSTIHLFNLEKSQELIFDPPHEEEDGKVILRHNIYIDGPGVGGGSFMEYYEDGSFSNGQFMVD